MRTGRMTAGRRARSRNSGRGTACEYSPQVLSLDALFGRAAQSALEFGFGNGEHLARSPPRLQDVTISASNSTGPGVGIWLSAGGH